MIRPVLVACGLLASGPALAISCEPPTIAQTFGLAQEAPSSYVIIKGRFDFDRGLLPQDHDLPEAVPPAVPARFTGHALVPDGFTQAVTLDLALQPVCFGAFCGSFPQDTEVLAFARQTEAGLVVDADPCSIWAFVMPTEDDIQTLLNCMSQGACPQG